jgi:hypothetical protein
MRKAIETVAYLLFNCLKIADSRKEQQIQLVASSVTHIPRLRQPSSESVASKVRVPEVTPD